MATDKVRAQMAEKVAKQADLNVNVVLRVFYALEALGYLIKVPVEVPVVTRSTSPETSSKRVSR